MGVKIPAAGTLVVWARLQNICNLYDTPHASQYGRNTRVAQFVAHWYICDLRVCSGCVYMPCMAYTRLCQVLGYAK